MQGGVGQRDLDVVGLHGLLVVVAVGLGAALQAPQIVSCRGEDRSIEQSWRRKGRGLWQTAPRTRGGRGVRLSRRAQPWVV